MAVHTPYATGSYEHDGAAHAPEYTGYDTEEERGYGWMIYAGVLLLILGTINLIEGIAAVGNANFFVHNTHYVIGDLNAWGWTVLCIGACQFLAGVGVFVKNQFARWFGVVVLGANALAQMLMMPAYPFWSLSILAVDILAIYGLIVYGKRTSSA